MIQTRRAALALIDGDLDRAEALIDDAGRIGEQIHEPDTGNVLMSQRVALASARRDPDELRTLAADAVRWWTGAPVLAHAVAAGALAKAGDLDGAEREVAKVDASGGWQSEGSYLRSVLVGHLAEASVALGDRELCARSPRRHRGHRGCVRRERSSRGLRRSIRPQRGHPGIRTR